MKKLIIIAILITFYSCNKEITPIYSVKKDIIKIKVGTRIIDWRIDPKIDIDEFEIYSKGKKTVTVYLQKDSINIDILPNSSKNIYFVLNNDTTLTKFNSRSSFPNKISLAKKLHDLSLFWSEAKYNFANFDELKFNWDSLYYSFIPQIINTKNDYEFLRLMQQFAANLKDAHSGVWGGNLSSYLDYIPLNFSNFNEKIYITNARKGIGLDSSIIGAKVTSINGIETNEYLEKYTLPFISSSTQGMKNKIATSIFSYGKKYEVVNLKIIKNNGRDTIIKLKRNGEETRRKNQEYLIERSAWKFLECEDLGNSILLLKANSFSSLKKFKYEFAKHSKKIHNSKGLVIDLRKNGGGTTDVAIFLAKKIIKANSFNTFSAQTRIHNATKKANGNYVKANKSFYLMNAFEDIPSIAIKVEENEKKLNMPIIILTSEYTCSAAEDFLLMLYEHNERPLIIGSETAGSSGSPLVIKGFKSGIGARVCAKRIIFPLSKKRFVNQGIKPDIKIENSIINFLNNKDIVLDTAYNILLKKIQK
jgi:C-terminal processing protease CtpA/Prc